MDVTTYEAVALLVISAFLVLFTSIVSDPLVCTFLLSLAYLTVKVLGYHYKVYRVTHNPLESCLQPLVKCIGSLITTLLSAIPIYFLFIAFGAPLFESVRETLVLSLSVSILTVFPCALAFRPTFRYWISKLILLELYSIQELYLVLQVYAVSLCVWLSAFPILLDWNRPWQKWPIPSLIGAWLGFCVSQIGSLVLHTVGISRKFKPRSFSVLT